jgi:hypothetical protein
MIPAPYNINLLYQKLNFMANKYHIGQALTPEEFTTMLVSSSDEHFSNELNRLEAMMIQNPNIALSRDVLKGLEPFVTKKDSWTIPTGTGVLNLPKRFAKLLKASSLYGSPVSRLLKVDYVSEVEADELRQNPGLRDLQKTPVCVREGSSLRFFPKNLTSVNLTYLRKPWIPYYHYTVDSTLDSQTYHVTEVRATKSIQCSASSTVVTITASMWWNEDTGVNEGSKTIGVTSTASADPATTVAQIITTINNTDYGFYAETGSLGSTYLKITAPAGWGDEYNTCTFTFSGATFATFALADGDDGSVQLEWDLQEWHKIEAIILAKVGINQRDGDLVNFAMANEAKDDNVEKQILR